MTLVDICKFTDLDENYLKHALSVYAPELMEPYREWDLDDDSLNEKYIFEDSTETWKLITFTVCGSWVDDVAKSHEYTLKSMEVHQLHLRKV